MLVGARGQGDIRLGSGEQIYVGLGGSGEHSQLHGGRNGNNANDIFIFHGIVFGLGPLLLNEPVKSLRDTGRGIGHGNHRAVAGDVGQGLPVWTGKGIGVAHRVRLAEFALYRNHKSAVHGGWRKEDGRGTNPKTALDGEPGAAGHGGQRLGDGAYQLEAAAGIGFAAAGNDTTGDGEPRTALGEGAC